MTRVEAVDLPIAIRLNGIDVEGAPDPAHPAEERRRRLAEALRDIAGRDNAFDDLAFVQDGDEIALLKRRKHLEHRRSELGPIPHHAGFHFENHPFLADFVSTHVAIDEYGTAHH
ncbi:hypothetical protein NQK81_30470 [Amycolatopsis roodepoortensis]|uniref:hypothetical protein n=1 Tax=Amycolatopsis roodepoortensis TaxID=700274 RepID=UPI00214CF5A4|nr:hypothetical protein [Amycolatopsis roodepoortensis]UUV29084.1 hypothetical protein NQK81_30470 [Amycolatopsis roodepoortensis]